MLFLLGLAARLAPWSAAREGGTRLNDPDCYGHLRRSHQTAVSFPRVPVHDPYLNHPDGGIWIWPPAFDLLVGGTSRAVHGRAVRMEDTLEVAAFLPAVLGALHVPLLVLFARGFLGRRRALVAGLAYAVLPGALQWGGYGHADHHVLEALALLVVLLAALRAVREGSPVAALAAGAAVGGTLLVWQGAVFIAALAFLWALFALGERAGLFAASATAVAALGTLLALGGERVPFTFISFSWFQPVLLGAGTIVLALASAVRERRPRMRVANLAGALVLALLLSPFADRVAGRVLGGFGYAVVGTTAAEEMADGGFLSYPPEFLPLVGEARRLLAGGLKSVPGAVRNLSPGFLLLPAVLVVWGIRAARTSWPRPGHGRRAKRHALLLAVLFGSSILALTLFQKRSVYYLVIFTALALAEVVVSATVRIARRARRNGLALPLGAAVALALVVGPGAPLLRGFHAYAGTPGTDFLSMLERLRALDPPPRTPWTGGVAPGEIPGVMNPWAAGHFVTALTFRPSAADPNVYGFRRQCRLFTTPSDDEAWRILTDARCRYLLTANLRAVLPLYAGAAGRPGIPIESTFAVRVHEGQGPRPVPFLEEVLSSRTGGRLPDGRFAPAYRIFRVLDRPSP